MGGGCLFLVRCGPWKYGKIFRKVSQSMSVFQALSLMIAFGILVATLSNKKDK